MVHYCSVHGKWTYILYIYTYVCVLSQQNFERMLTLERAPTFGKQAESLLGEKLISPTRRLIREGAAMKLSARTGELNERYLFLVCTPASNAYISRRQYSEHSRHATQRPQRPQSTRIVQSTTLDSTLNNNDLHFHCECYRKQKQRHCPLSSVRVRTAHLLFSLSCPFTHYVYFPYHLII